MENTSLHSLKREVATTLTKPNKPQKIKINKNKNAGSGGRWLVAEQIFQTLP